MYYEGSAALVDQKKAGYWFRKAAEQPPEAQYVLGLLYCYHVAGLPQDVVLADMLSNLSAAGGQANAENQRGQADEPEAGRGSAGNVAHLEGRHAIANAIQDRRRVLSAAAETVKPPAEAGGFFRTATVSPWC
jgi:TPR repeat protein